MRDFMMDGGGLPRTIHSRVFIFAGYEDKLAAFLAMRPGSNRQIRFVLRVTF